MLIYHYVRKFCYKCNKNHVEDIEKEQVLKTEAKVHVWNDGINSDLLWFTEEETVSGGSSNFLMQHVRSFSQLYYTNISKKEIEELSKDIETKDQINNAYHFRCYVFDSNEIEAEKWNLVKVKWSRISPKRQDYVRKIDSSSMQNGDSLESYWVTKHNVNLNLCKKKFDISQTRKERLKRFGFEDLYDFFIWQKETVLNLYGRNITDSKKIDDKLGEIMLSRDTKKK
jgi:hypothetical protein